MSRPIPFLERDFDVRVELGPLEDHGVTRVGHRRVIPIVGGRIRGGIEAEIVPGGADWQVVRPDGSIEIDARYSARTTAGDWIHLRTAGVRSGDSSVLAALLRGDPVNPWEYYFRTSVMVETSSPELAHYQRQLYIAVAERTESSVHFDAYRVT